MKAHKVVALVSSLFASLATASPPNYNNPGPTATISSGVVHGVATTVPGSSVTVNKFLGIPYAAQPERFSPARPPAPWSTPYEATAYGPACIQQFPYPAEGRDRNMEWFNQPPPAESEDCLNLNVFAPATRGKKAVLLWIHGVRASRSKW
jgi:carboxylesterase 3/5